MEAEATFRAMGSDAHVIVIDGPDDSIDRARTRIDELERRWSRFLPDSEVSALNRRSGEALTVSADTLLLIERSIEAWSATGGAFDPTVLWALVRAGYDRSYELLDTQSPAETPTRGWNGAPGPVPESARLADQSAGSGADIGEFVVCSDIEVCPASSTVRLPDGAGFDPGGIGKGLAADLVVEELRALGAAGVCVNLGGDLRVSGVGPGGGEWIVDIEAPGCPTPIARVRLAEGAVATSTTQRRRWGPDRTQHHLIDPATAEPSTSDLAQATVVAGAAWLAEVHAKTVLLRGSPHQFDLIDGVGPEGLSVAGDGTIARTPGLGRLLVH